MAYTLSKRDQPGAFIGAVRARDSKEDQISLEELEWLKRKLRERGQEVDNDSIWAERLGLYEFIDKKRKSKRQKRRDAQQRRNQKTNQSKLVELFPQNADPENQLAVQENTTPATEQSQPSVVEFTHKPTSSQPIASNVVAYDWNQLVEDNW
ncbi:MAG TPA: hypothetical protein V6C84_15845 [Coleofasciculaceae cyanobacterium]